MLYAVGASFWFLDVHKTSLSKDCHRSAHTRANSKSDLESPERLSQYIFPSQPFESSYSFLSYSLSFSPQRPSSILLKLTFPHPQSQNSYFSIIIIIHNHNHGQNQRCPLLQHRTRQRPPSRCSCDRWYIWYWRAHSSSASCYPFEHWEGSPYVYCRKKGSFRRKGQSRMPQDMPYSRYSFHTR